MLVYAFFCDIFEFGCDGRFKDRFLAATGLLEPLLDGIVELVVDFRDANEDGGSH